MRAIALLPVASPARLEIQDSNLAPAFMSVKTFKTPDEEKKHAAFHQGMAVSRDFPGAKLFSDLRLDLKSAGFETSLFEGIGSGLKDSRNGDGRASHRQPEMLLQAAFAHAGMATRLWSTDYEPRVNVSVHLRAGPDSIDWLVTDFFYYGADSSGDTARSVPADPRYRFESVQAMFDNPDEVAEGSPQRHAVQVTSVRNRSHE